MIYEMIIYRCEEGTSCTEPLTLDRFKNSIQTYWENYGIPLLDSWTVTSRDSGPDLYYVICWESLNQRQEKIMTMDVGHDLKPKHLFYENFTLTSYMSIMNTNPERLFRAISDW